MPTRAIQLGDEVKNLKGNDIYGSVIAKYLMSDIVDNVAVDATYIDIRTDDRIYYCSPIENWETVRKVEDIE